MSPCEAALAYADQLGWPVFPRAGPRPLVPHGYRDATRDAAQIARWWQRWPAALIGVPTGRAANHRDGGLVVLDIDRKGGADGFATLEELGRSLLPTTPMAHSPHAGLHLYFAVNPHCEIGCSQGRDGLGPGLDVKGEGGSITVPTPGSLYRWDPHARPSLVPLMIAPAWLATRRRRRQGPQGGGRPPLDPLAILAQACRLIRDAPPGERHAALNRQAFIVGCMAARGALDERHARHELEAAAAAMVWGSAGDTRKAGRDLADAFRDGLRKGRRANGHWRRGTQ